MQITTMASHEKNKMMENRNIVRSPMSATNTYGSRPPTNDQYESAASKGKKDEVDGIIKTIKSLKTQIKSLKDENKILK